MKEFFFNHVVCINVVDGDTIDVQIDVGFDFITHQRLRLYGIDTPERNAPLFEEAKRFVMEMVLDRDIQIITYKKDSFGRWLSIVYVDGINVNEELVKEGLAVIYR